MISLRVTVSCYCSVVVGLLLSVVTAAVLAAVLPMTGGETSRADKTTTTCRSERVRCSEAVQAETSAVTHGRHSVNTAFDALCCVV